MEANDVDNVFQKRKMKCELALKLGFKYNAENGDIICPTGKIATKKTKNGYVMLTLRSPLNAYYLYAHQFAWFVIHRNCVTTIDHINSVKTDNRINNLRAVTKSVNALNVKSTKGVFFCKRSKKYIATVTDNYKRKQLGSFDTFDEASEKYKQYKNNLITWKLQEQ